MRMHVSTYGLELFEVILLLYRPIVFAIGTVWRSVLGIREHVRVRVRVIVRVTLFLCVFSGIVLFLDYCLYSCLYLILL